jgi:putative two-component system response regulator
LAKARVLIVDDYAGARYRRMRLLLDDGGFDVAEESMGRDALQRIARDPFDVVVLDLHLPDISGLDVCRGIRSDPRNGGTPILMISAVSESDTAEQLAKDAGATAFVADGTDGDAFVSAVRQALG